MSKNLALALKTDQLSETIRLANMSEQDRRLFAIKACNERDVGKLWLIFESHIRLYSKQKNQTSRHTVLSYKATLKMLIQAWKGENLIRPSENAGALWLLELQQLGRKPGTVENRLAGARAFYKALRWTKATSADPFQDLSPPQDKTPDWEKVKPYSEDEVEKLLNVCGDAFDTCLVLLGAHGGLRVSEMCSLTWDDVIWQKKQVRVLGKGAKLATVTLSSRAINALLQAKGETRRHNKKRNPSLVFSFDTHGARSRMRGLCKLAGVEYKGKAVHGLRHGAGTKYYKQTKDLGRVAAHLRHENIQTTRIYAKLADDAISEDLKDW